MFHFHEKPTVILACAVYTIVSSAYLPICLMELGIESDIILEQAILGLIIQGLLLGMVYVLRRWISGCAAGWYIMRGSEEENEELSLEMHYM